LSTHKSTDKQQLFPDRLGQYKRIGVVRTEAAHNLVQGDGQGDPCVQPTTTATRGPCRALGVEPAGLRRFERVVYVQEVGERFGKILRGVG